MQKVAREIQNIYSKSMPMINKTDEDELEHMLSTKCFLCKRRLHDYDDVSRKQADHCHITGKYRGPACKHCNLNNLTLKGIPIPVVFHNFSGYDSKLIMQHVQELQLSVIASSTEKIRCATLFTANRPDANVYDDDDDDAEEEIDDDVEEESRQKKQKKFNTLKFIDSLAFLNSSLDNLSSMLEDGDKRDLDAYLTYKCLRKFRSEEEVDLLYEGRVRHDDELQQLVNERTRNHARRNKETDISPYDTFDYRNRIYDDITLTEMEHAWKVRAKELVTKKGVFPYSWFDSDDKLGNSQPPSQADFFNDLTQQHISDELYQHMLDVWHHFDFGNFGEYMEMYMELDVILLQCVVERFRTQAARNYSNLDPMRYEIII